MLGRGGGRGEVRMTVTFLSINCTYSRSGIGYEGQGETSEYSFSRKKAI